MMEKLGNILSLTTIVMIGLSFFTVLMHYLFNVIYISIQELIIYLHSAAFMLGIVYAYHHDKHVRIDIFYQNQSTEKQNKINELGTLFLLLPLFAFMFYAAFDYVLSSWSRLEGSAEPGGIPFVYGLKTLLLIMPLSMVAYSLFKTINLRKN